MWTGLALHFFFFFGFRLALHFFFFGGFGLHFTFGSRKTNLEWPKFARVELSVCAGFARNERTDCDWSTPRHKSGSQGCGPALLDSGESGVHCLSYVSGRLHEHGLTRPAISNAATSQHIFFPLLL